MRHGREGVGSRSQGTGDGDGPASAPPSLNPPYGGLSPLQLAREMQFGWTMTTGKALIRHREAVATSDTCNSRPSTEFYSSHTDILLGTYMYFGRHLTRRGCLASSIDIHPC